MPSCCVAVSYHVLVNANALNRSIGLIAVDGWMGRNADIKDGTAYDVSLIDDGWTPEIFNVILDNTSSSWERLDVCALSHTFELESIVKTEFHSKPAVVTFHVPTKVALQVGLENDPSWYCRHFHGVQDEKRVWFEVELHGAQGDCKAEVFQENVTNLGLKVGANIMVTGVPGQEGAEGTIAEKKKVKESMKANLRKLLKYKAWLTRRSPVQVMAIQYLSFLRFIRDSWDKPADNDTPDTPPSPTHGTPFTKTTLSTQRSPTTSGALRHDIIILVSSSETSSDSPADALSDSASSRSSSDHSLPSSPSGTRSSHRLCSLVPSVHRSSAISERPSHDSSSVSRSRKRSRSPVASVLLSSPTLGELSYARAYILPSPKRIRSPETATNLEDCSEDRFKPYVPR
ncbi:hypothetical protein Tco_0143619 [Tanacetum coccineum]